MSRFVEVNGEHVSIDTIKSYYQSADGRLYVQYLDGTESVVSSKVAAYVMERLNGADYIIQVIPVMEPVYAVYTDEQPDTYFAEPVHYLALCADGEIRGVEYCDGWFECVSIEHGNCVGLYHKDQLMRFPGVETVEEFAKSQPAGNLEKKTAPSAANTESGEKTQQDD